MRACSILIVEDEQIVSLDLQQNLEEMGYSVAGATDNGEDAVALARKLKPSVVLMDIMLRGKMDGIEAAKHIGRGLRIPVIFLSAYGDPRTVQRAVTSAPYGFLTKPFQSKELRAAIEVALYKARMEEQLRKSEHWFASTLRCVSDAVIATDADSRVTFLNPAAELLTGWDAKEAEGHPIDELVRLVSRRDGTAIESVAQRAMRENKAVGIEFGTRLIMQSGETVPVDDSAAPIRDENDKLLGVIIVMRDVSERLRQEELLRNSEERFRNAFEFSAAGMAMVGLEGDFLQINDAFCIMVGYPHEELMGKPHTLVGYIAAPEQERDCLYSLLSGEAPSVQFEKCYRHRDGREVWTLASVSLLTAGEQPVCYLYQVYDVTERKEAEVQLERMAYSDPLTGLNNRAHLGREIERMLAEARRHRQHLAVVFVDLDRFKQINDTLGHLAGDELLRVAAERLREALRDTDYVARLGGDEFVLVLPEVQDPANVGIVTEKLRNALAAPVRLGERELVVTASMGVSFYPDDGTDTEMLLRCADNALFSAKADGRNRVHFFRMELGQQASEKLDIETALYGALARDELSLAYQPIVRPADGVIVAVEALIRWNRDGKAIPPQKFIPLADETGLILPIGERVLQMATVAAAAWPSPVIVNVNCAARQFREPGFDEVVAQALKASGLPGSRLCLELTEDVMLQRNDHQLELLHRLRDRGVTLSIDDYGTGYSSLAYLKHYAPRSLKIDRYFVNDVVSDPTSAAIVSATIAMAHDLGLEVIAEGVETEEQAAHLLAEGCDLAQGYYYSHPQSNDAVTKLLKTGRLK